MADEENISGYIPLQRERQSVLHGECSEYAQSAVALIDAIKAHITVTPVYVPNEARSDIAGIPLAGGMLVPVAFYEGPAITYRRVESYLPSSAHPEPHELAVEKEIHGYMRNIAGLACKVAAAERMQKWWSNQKGLEARAQQLAEGVRATAQFSQLKLAEADLVWAEHARDWTTRVPSKIAKSLRFDLDELVVARNLAGKPVTTEDIDTLLGEYRQQGLRELYEEVDLSSMGDDTFSAQTTPGKANSIIFSPSASAAHVHTDNSLTYHVASAAIRTAEITMLLAPAFVACQNAPTPIPLTPIPQGATEIPVPTNSSTVIPEAPEVATPLPGGPDDEQVIANTLPWPSSISDITEDIPAAGGPYNIVDVDAPNVRKQFDGVKSLLIHSGFTVTSVDNATHLVDKQALLFLVENGKLGDKAQWAIAGITNKGFVIPVDKDGTVMDRPDWATSNVAEYVELTDGYGPEYQRFWEEYNGHWVPVVRDANGKLVAFYDINKGEFMRNIMTPEPSATPAELVIGCREGQQAKQTLDAFRTTHDVSQLLTGVDSSPTWIFSNIGPGQDRPSWETFNYNGLLVGEYKVDLVGKDVAGYTPKANSYAMCYVFVTPDAPNTPRVVVGSLVVEGEAKRQLIANEAIVNIEVFEKFMRENIGKKLEFDILVGSGNFEQKEPPKNIHFSSPSNDWARNFINSLGYLRDTSDPSVAQAIPLHDLVGRVSDDGFGLLLRQVREK